MTLAEALPPADGDDDRRRELDESFRRFVQEQYSILLKFLQRQCFDTHLAEDALHEALIVAMGKWEVVSAHDQPLYWVRKTAWHKLQTLQSRQRWRTQVPLEQMPHDVIQPVGPHEAEAVLRVVLSRLPYLQRAVLALVMEGESDDDIARQLSLAVSTVRTYKCEARKRYREMLRDGGSA